MKQRLNLSEDLYPVEAFFNVLSDDKFMAAIAAFATGHGYNPEDKTCDFPADLAEEDGGPAARFNYIEFWTYAGNQEARISFADFLQYATEAVTKQIEFRPDQASDLNQAMSSVRDVIGQLEFAHRAFTNT